MCCILLCTFNDDVKYCMSSILSLFVSLPLSRCLSPSLALLLIKIDATHRKEGLKVMTETFYAAIFGYDEVKYALIYLTAYNF